MKFNIGDKVKYKGGSNLVSTIIGIDSKTRRYTVEYPDTSICTWHEDELVLDKNSTEYWYGFDDGYRDQIDDPSVNMKKGLIVEMCEFDFKRGYFDGCDFAMHFMQMDDINPNYYSPNYDERHGDPDFSAPEDADYEDGYDAGYHDAETELCFDKTVTTGHYSDEYDNGYIAGYYHARFGKQRNNRRQKFGEGLI